MGKRQQKNSSTFYSDRELKKLVMDFINKDEVYMANILDTNSGTRTWGEMLKLHPSSMPARWFNSNFSDFEHYNDEEYVAVGYDCFTTMSKKSINALATIKQKVNNSIEPYTETRKIKASDVNDLCHLETFIDCGAGIGATTAILKLAYPDAKVYYHNLRNSMQWKFSEMLFDALNIKVEMISNISEITEKTIDCVCALEYFEHFKEPFTEVKKFLTLNPKWILDSSRFTQACQGHFEHYTVDGKDVYHRKVQKLYKEFLASMGYEYSYISDFQWNRYPTFYKNTSA